MKRYPNEAAKKMGRKYYPMSCKFQNPKTVERLEKVHESTNLSYRHIIETAVELLMDEYDSQGPVVLVRPRNRPVVVEDFPRSEKRQDKGA